MKYFTFKNYYKALAAFSLIMSAAYCTSVSGIWWLVMAFLHMYLADRATEVKDSKTTYDIGACGGAGGYYLKITRSDKSENIFITGTQQETLDLIGLDIERRNGFKG